MRVATETVSIASDIFAADRLTCAVRRPPTERQCGIDFSISARDRPTQMKKHIGIAMAVLIAALGPEWGQTPKPKNDTLDVCVPSYIARYAALRNG